ncbi:hypothetical protein [Paracraurococcus ruber]|uniref:Invasion protein IalB, involved in pathogenesis n=1 Tax=Paracraurococcus ruber TaxID=77675 RepID=A0ABS1D4X9_9PROT|nr:hypothetical protein [Paracraurococcus ruber]MBK1661606.1 hypothetical protein [Paracraurococcus ruber]TDG18640.1 hypothetical protein E2C05_28015 [Paracraurococcus ruber]
MTRPASLALALILPLLPLPAGAAAQPVEEIGAWRLACQQDRMTDRAACSLRHRDWVERPAAGTPGLALEVIDRRGRLVPAVTARELTIEGATRGLLALTGTAQLRFPPNRLFEMPCGLEGRSVVCAPRPEDAARAEQELLAAGTALVRIVGGTGQSSTAEPTELRLAGTRDALARFAREAPPDAAREPEGFDGREMLQRMFRFFGTN